MTGGPDGCTPARIDRRQLLGAVGGSVLVGGLGLGFAADSASRPLQPPAEPVPRAYFGLHVHRLAERQPWSRHGDQLTAWPDIAFGTLRLWDALVAWPSLQPEPGRWRFEALDRLVHMAERAGVQVLLPLGLSPSWASARPTEASSYRPGNAAEPGNMDHWRHYVRTVAQRYRGRIRQYEIWNEINLKGFFSGSLETMVELARIAHGEIKQIDPAAVVVSPSVTGDGKHPQWLARYLGLGGGQWADVIGYHFYVPKSAPEAMLPVIQEVQHIMGQHGLAQRPLWNTETGWWIENLQPTQRLGAAGADWRALNQAMAAAYVARSLLLGWSAGLGRFCWYAWDNTDMGLFDMASQSPKAAATAYARVVDWLTGRHVSACSVQDGIWRCELVGPDGHKLRVVWREQGSPTEWPVPQRWGVSGFESLQGDRGLVGQGLLLGQSPVLLH